MVLLRDAVAAVVVLSRLAAVVLLAAAAVPLASSGLSPAAVGVGRVVARATGADRGTVAAAAALAAPADEICRDDAAGLSVAGAAIMLTLPAAATERPAAGRPAPPVPGLAVLAAALLAFTASFFSSPAVAAAAAELLAFAGPGTEDTLVDGALAAAPDRLLPAVADVGLAPLTLPPAAAAVPLGAFLAAGFLVGLDVAVAMAAAAATSSCCGVVVSLLASDVT
jgi:hypothetical protein